MKRACEITAVIQFALGVGFMVANGMPKTIDLIFLGWAASVLAFGTLPAIITLVSLGCGLNQQKDK